MSKIVGVMDYDSGVCREPTQEELNSNKSTPNSNIDIVYGDSPQQPLTSDRTFFDSLSTFKQLHNYAPTLQLAPESKAKLAEFDNCLSHARSRDEIGACSRSILTYVKDRDEWIRQMTGRPPLK
jgi:hypothetical protein